MTDADVSDQERIQGSWRSVRIETLGDCYDDDMGVGHLITYAGDLVTRADGTVHRFRLDPSRAPKELDLIPADSDRVLFWGIYAFEGDRLITCFNSVLSPRPAGFGTQDSSAVLTYFERVEGALAGGDHRRV